MCCALSIKHLTIILRVPVAQTVEWLASDQNLPGSILDPMSHEVLNAVHQYVNG